MVHGRPDPAPLLRWLARVRGGGDDGLRGGLANVEAEDIPIPGDLEGAHPFVTNTWHAAAAWHATPDDRLSPQAEPGIVDVRVSRRHLPRALRLVQVVIERSSDVGLEVAPVNRAPRCRAGIGIGRDGAYTPVRVQELRDRLHFADLDLERWRREHPVWLFREDEMRERGWVPRANGKLRLVLPRRYDRPPAPDYGWRSTFTDQDGRPVEQQVTDAVAALAQRAAADVSP